MRMCVVLLLGACGGRSGMSMAAGGDGGASEPPADGWTVVDQSDAWDVAPCPYGCAVSCVSAFPVVIPGCRIPTGCQDRPLHLDDTFIDNLGYSTLTDPPPGSVSAAQDRMENYDVEAICNVHLGDTVFLFTGNPQQPLGWTLRGLLDPDGDGVRTPIVVHVPVVQGDGCSVRATKGHVVAGFAALRIEDVGLPTDPEPETYLDGTLLCGEADRPCGGGDFGLHRVDCE